MKSAEDPGHPATTHLRRLLETQPACLMRMDLESRLLAVNAAALRFLPVPNLAAALGRRLLEFVPADCLDRWKPFAERIGAGGEASFECEIEDASAIRRSILFHGVALLDHPDGVGSAIVTAQDTSAVRRLEDALTARARELAIQSHALGVLEAECARLRAALSDRQHEWQSAIRALDAPIRLAVEELRGAATAVASVSRQLAGPDAMIDDVVHLAHESSLTR